MEAIEVTVHFSETGKSTPLRFTWNKSTYLIESVGRQWQDEQGLHFLVMVTGGRMFELLFDCETRCWFLERIGPGPMIA
ncbi:MAG: hypothetical protein JW726_08545 [Anaerolineales bacterium]|nr:hypothetical protein [Anaerolineales bacterium]